MDFADFFKKWSVSGAAERANKDMFLLDFCRWLGVDEPSPSTGDPDHDVYVFERAANMPHEERGHTVGKMDLYKKGCFVLEAKQGSDTGSKRHGTARRDTPAWAIAMSDAYGQAIGYAQTLEAPPPFVISCDIGYCFDLYAAFDGTTAYRPFPSARDHRIFFKDLEKHRDTFRAIFLEPRGLDPALKATKVTREVARYLADLARALEKEKHDPQLVALFLMRCIFTMFAEDIGLLPPKLFTKQIESWIEKPKSFPLQVEQLWRAMNSGGEIFGLEDPILKFNGGLFAQPSALPLAKEHLQILLLAALQDWSDVEPAIFGTLLERALDAKERHQLGAHFTPRAYVERLVRPTVEEPLRAEWDVVKAQVRQLVAQAKPEPEVVRPGEKRNVDPKIAEAREVVSAFHKRLCAVRVLDPACGSGNFLYVTLDLFKRLEGEVLLMLRDLGVKGELLAIEGVRVSPAQFFGIEVKPWAKEIAELVLWIGYIQWHYRTPGRERHPPEPILQNYGNIECRDAVLAWDGEPELIRDPKTAKPITRWDGVTTKKSPVTGEQIPDEAATVPVYRYKNPRKAEWPKADFVVGNPPFVGNKRMRIALGDGYVEALRAAHDDVPESADFVMYWWNHSAHLLRQGAIRRFGLITTNSITQAYNRAIVESHIDAKVDASLVFAVADHPWVDSIDGAAVRIAMTVVGTPRRAGTLLTVVGERETDRDEVDVQFRTTTGDILPSLTIGANAKSGAKLHANEGLSFMGVTTGNQGFILKPRDPLCTLKAHAPFLKPFLIGRDMNQQPQDRLVVDLFGMSLESAQEAAPKLVQHLVDHVKPERDQVARKAYRENWWVFVEGRGGMRRGLSGLKRYIATCRTAAHRVFVFVPGDVVVESTVIAISLDDAFFLGVLSSHPHVAWTLASGGTLEDRPRYNNSVCFDPFPFPAANDLQTARIRKLGEALDAHRKKQQAAHPELTITGMYNVLEKLRAGEALNAKEKVIHEQGLVSVLKQIHDDLDAAVIDAYGWMPDINDEQILERLVKLNAERAEEEKKGLVRWLRPEFQVPRAAKTTAKAKQATLALVDDADDGDTTEPGVDGKAVKGGKKKAAPKVELPAWPKQEKLAERIAAVRDVAINGGPWTAKAVALHFKGGKEADVAAVLDSLAALGLLVAYDTPDGRRWKSAMRVGV